MVKSPTNLKKLILATGVLTLATPVFAYAVKVGVEIPGYTMTETSTYLDYIGAVFNFAFKAGIALTTLMIIYAGIKYMTSQGNQSALGEAKDIIVGSLSGMAMLALTVLILTLLGLPVFK